MNEKKWLFVIPADTLHGSELIAKTFVEFLVKKKQKCHVIILTRKYSEQWEHLRPEVEITYLSFNNYFKGVLWLLPHLLVNNQVRFDYTFTSQSVINGTIGFAKRLGLLGNPIVILRESNSIFKLLKGYKSKIYSFFYHLGYKYSSLVVCQTTYMKEQLVLAQPALTKKLNLTVISNPFEVDKSKSPKDPLPPKFEKTSFLVAAGRLAPAKGFDILINTFNKYQKDLEGVSLIILGEGPDRKLLEEQINELKLENRVFMPGYVQNVYPYFHKAKTCVISSRIEGFPNVLLQMMSVNEKVVCTLSAGDIDSIPGIYTCITENEMALGESIIECISASSHDNRSVFDHYLEQRSWENFYRAILDKVSETKG